MRSKRIQPLCTLLQSDILESMESALHVWRSSFVKIVRFVTLFSNQIEGRRDINSMDALVFRLVMS